MKFAAAYASIIFGLKSMMRDYFFRTGLTKCPGAITHHDTVERLKLWQPDGWLKVSWRTETFIYWRKNVSPLILLLILDTEAVLIHKTTPPSICFSHHAWQGQYSSLRRIVQISIPCIQFHRPSAGNVLKQHPNLDHEVQTPHTIQQNKPDGFLPPEGQNCEALLG